MDFVLKSKYFLCSSCLAIYHGTVKKKVRSSFSYQFTCQSVKLLKIVTEDVIIAVQRTKHNCNNKPLKIGQQLSLFCELHFDVIEVE